LKLQIGEKQRFFKYSRVNDSLKKFFEENSENLDKEKKEFLIEF